MYSIRRHAGNNNYESGCILLTHHVVSMMTEFRKGLHFSAFHYICGDTFVGAWPNDLRILCE